MLSKNVVVIEVSKRVYFLSIKKLWEIHEVTVCYISVDYVRIGNRINLRRVSFVSVRAVKLMGTKEIRTKQTKKI